MRLELNPDLAKCASPKIDPDIFFMDDKMEDNYNAMKTEIARSICGTCELQKKCLDFALREDQEGVWGGTTTYERRVAKDRKRKNYVPVGKRGPSISGMKAIAKSNEIRTIATSNRDKELVMKALTMFSDIDPLTLKIAKLRIAMPGLPLSELSGMLGISKDVFAGRLKRLIRRLDNNG